MVPLRGRTALVTGASRGIGVYIAQALAAQGMQLILTARSEEALARVADGLRTGGAAVRCLPADVSDRAQLEALATAAEAEGGVDVLVNNAGLDEAIPYDKALPERLDRLIDVNLRAPMILTRLLLPKMIARGRGHIVNVASLAGLIGVPYEEAYSATKHGLVGFTRSLRGTAIGEGYPVGASVICPGFISAVGMYADATAATGMEAPATFGTSSPEDVAQAVVHAIVEDEPEIVVNAMPVRPMLLLQTLSPRLFTWVGKRTGVVELLRGMAYHRIEERTAKR